MADLTLTADWGGVFRVEDTTPLLGHNAANGALPFGVDGPDNRQAKDIGNRTEYLRRRIEGLLLQVAAPLGTYNLVATLGHRGVRVAADDSGYVGANAAELTIPAGEYVVVNECRYPVGVTGPSGIRVEVPARTSPNASIGLVLADALDTLLLETSTPALRPVSITSIVPAVLDSAGVTSVVITGKGFLGTEDAEVVGVATSFAFTVVSDTEITADIDGVALALVPGADQVRVFRTGAENALIAVTVT